VRSYSQDSRLIRNAEWNVHASSVRSVVVENVGRAIKGLCTKESDWESHGEVAKEGGGQVRKIAYSAMSRWVAGDGKWS